MTTHPEGILDIGAALFYLLASAGYGAHLLLRQPALAHWGRLAGWGGVLLQTGAIGVHCAATGRTPFTTPAETLTASAWAVALVYLLLEAALRPPKPLALGAFALPAAFLCLFGGSALSLTTMHGPLPLGPSHDLNSRIVSLHVIALLFAFGLLTLAFGTAALHLTQHGLLKRRHGHRGLRQTLWGKLPPLASLEQTAFALVAFAFPLLTIGLLAGMVLAAAGGLAPGWVSDPKTLASGVTWLVYAGYLILHRTASGRGPRASYLLLGGLLAALVTYLVPTGAHRFG